ncbi:hypothetical protein Pelo_19165 [Pelomyxa schiedti]|nr:hypothetical protein Pelo_19165 [Pelomyxa schiedti]
MVLFSIRPVRKVSSHYTTSLFVFTASHWCRMWLSSQPRSLPSVCIFLTVTTARLLRLGPTRICIPSPFVITPPNSWYQTRGTRRSNSRGAPQTIIILALSTPFTLMHSHNASPK